MKVGVVPGAPWAGVGSGNWECGGGSLRLAGEGSKTCLRSEGDNYTEGPQIHYKQKPARVFRGGEGLFCSRWTGR